MNTILNNKIFAKKSSEEFLESNKIELLNPLAFDPVNVNKILQSLSSVTLPFTDIQGNTLQLWKYRDKLIGLVLNREKKIVDIVFSSQIYNSLTR